MADLTTTPEGSEGKLPVDYKADDTGNVRISRGGQVTDRQLGEATQGTEGAQEGAKPEPKQEPVSKSYSEDEHKRIIETIKGGHDGTVKKMRGEMDNLKVQISDLTTQLEEREYSNWLRGLEEKGEDVDLAKQVIERDRAARKLQKELLGKESELKTLEAELNEAAFNKLAYDMLKQYNLDENYLETLINSENKWDMETKALKLAHENEQVKATPAVTTDPGNVKPTPKDTSNMHPERALGEAMEEYMQNL